MERFVLSGQIWWAEDNIYVETEKYYSEQRYEEICLNNYIKEQIKENSKVIITIDVL